MSDAQAELVRRCFAAWAAGDMHGWLATMTAEPEFVPGIVLRVEGERRYRGRDGLHAYWDEWAGIFSGSRIEIDEFHAAGPDRLVALGTLHSSAQGSGVDIQRPGGWVFDFEEGLISRQRSFPSWNEALVAAGLPAEGTIA